jgi:hypothetical protein
VDEDDTTALHHLAEAAQPLHRRTDLHLPLPPSFETIPRVLVRVPLCG